MVEKGTHSQSITAVAFEDLNELPVCRSLRKLTAPDSCHLVGGALRDCVLGTPSRDIDVVVSGRGQALAEAMADEYAARMIELGGDRFAAFRVMTGDSQVDIWDRGDNSLDSDLRRRDLTIHAFALDLHTGSITDPYGGLDDLVLRRLRMTTSDSFASDPLRVLRLCRFATQFPDFHLDPPTLQRAAQSTSDLTQVAAERIRAEIEATLSQPRADIAAQLWIEIGVLPDTLLGRVPSTEQRRQLISDSARTLAALEQSATAIPATTSMLIARAALLLRILESTLNVESTELADHLLRLGYLTKKRLREVSRILDAPPPPTEAPAQRWYLHSLGDLWVAAVCLAVGTQALRVSDESELEAPPGEIAALVDLAVDSADEIFDPPKLLTGRDLQSELGLEPGPELGRILAALRRQQIEGGLVTTQQALDLARRLITDWP